VDTSNIIEAIPAINNLSAILAIGCVSPTYFLHLRSSTYRWVLSLGIVSGLLTLATGILTIMLDIGSPDAYVLYPTLVFICFSPLNIVLLAILARIKRVSRVALWSTVVLVCVAIDWAGISLLFLSLQD
jgi:hypothetical protein